MLSKWRGDGLGLVVASYQPAVPMKRYGYHHVDFSLCFSERSLQAICQVPTEKLEAAEFEAMNDRIEWWLIGPSRQEPIQDRRPMLLGLGSGSFEDLELALATTAQSQG